MMTITSFFHVLPWLASLLLFAAAWGLLRWMRRDTKKMGALTEDNSLQGKTLDDVKKAHEARERLRTDPAYAERLRGKYERD